ncbi:hypothetical protein [Methylobacterium sp. 391_Methyba4]|uniref:hypothetical protein n=1 Tax=Methylobacterium sp. 391_Methyba4 TaxID=3038924 RepID=UPI00241CD981|nr:hypothetical protein [Methylobacterium sp. 391_Methyba4]WFS07674.1 hypothetical protein P9K36_30735 [Methylobacterium sp. 391_Methyba4]
MPRTAKQPEQQPAPQDPQPWSDDNRAEAAQIAAHCVANGSPELAAEFIAQGTPLAEVKERVSLIAKVTEMSMLACSVDRSLPVGLGRQLLAEGRSLQEIRSEFFARMVAKQDETAISSHVPMNGGNAGVSASRASMERTLKAAGVAPIADGRP